MRSPTGPLAVHGNLGWAGLPLCSLWTAVEMVLLSYPTDKRAWVSACPSMKCFLFTAVSIKDLYGNCPYTQTTGTDVTFHM